MNKQEIKIEVTEELFSQDHPSHIRKQKGFRKHTLSLTGIDGLDMEGLPNTSINRLSHMVTIGHYIFDKGQKRNKPIIFDHIPTKEEIQSHLERMKEEFFTVEMQQSEYTEQIRVQNEKMRIERELNAKHKREEAERKRQERMNIQWDEDGTAITDIYDVLMAVAEADPDSRFPQNQWVKRIDHVNTEHKNGYMFEGEFYRGFETIELEQERTVWLVKWSQGSNKSQTEHYQIILMDEDGNLIKTDIHTTGKTKGWALRIKKQVIELLEGE